MVFNQVILLSPVQCAVMNSRNYKRLREFEEIKILRRVTLNSKEENSYLDFCLDFVQELGLCIN
jgi:hypothetical protein